MMKIIDICVVLNHVVCVRQDFDKDDIAKQEVIAAELENLRVQLSKHALSQFSTNGIYVKVSTAYFDLINI